MLRDGSAGRGPAPPKPWERAGAGSTTNGPSPFAPASSTTSTAAAVAASSAVSGDQKDEAITDGAVVSGSTAGRPMPPRPWEQSQTGYGTGAIGSYGQSGLYGGGLGSTSYGTGAYGGYGASSYGSPYSRVGMYGGGYGGGYGGYGGSMYGGSYGSGMYGNRYGAGYGGMGGLGGGGGGYGAGAYGMGPGDPNLPGGGPPPQAPSFWQSLLQGLTGVMHFFGRLSMLVDENTQAFHFFITALLQLCDRAGVLYGELARFVLRLLGFRRAAKARARSQASTKALEGIDARPTQTVRPPSSEPGWDNVWKIGNGSHP